jgi:predicted permease
MKWLKHHRRQKPGYRLKQDHLVDREISFHLDALTEANIAKGMTPSEARRQAVIVFGGQEQIKQQVREVYVSMFVETLRANLRAATRFLRRSPSFALAVILTLALGIGANSAVFSAMDAIVLSPLGFPHGDELVRLHQENFKSKNPESFVAPLRLEDWNRMNSTFQVISGYYTQDLPYVSGGLPDKITEALVAPRFLDLWGVAPALGRDFTKEEQHFGGPNAVIVSDRFWRAHLNADPAAVGQPIRLGAYAYTVVGVMPRSFRFPDRDVDIWEPSAPDAPYSRGRDSTWFITLGRLKPGVTLRQASADLATVQTQLGWQYPKTDGDLTVRLNPLKNEVLNGIQNSLWLLYGSVTLLLLIACTNIAALLMARTAGRGHEIAIRFSLGASRTAIVSQLLTEVLVLALAGSLLGLSIAAGAPRVFTLFSKNLPRVDEIALNWRVVMYSLGCALAAALACGLVPAIRGTRRNLSGSLAQSSRTQVSGRNRGQWLLVGVQVSLAVALLIGSGLLLRSFQNLDRVDPGFEPSHVLTLHISGSWAETTDMARLVQRIDRTLDGLRSVPGVEAAATSATIPGNDFSYPLELKVSEGSQDPNQKIVADMRWVSAGYFRTLHIPVMEGEPCSDIAPPHGVVVNRSFAERYFGGAKVLGRHIASASGNGFLPSGDIRGVVGDAREEGLDIAPQPTVYACFSAPTMDPSYLIRTHGDPMAMADTIRRKIHELEPSRSVSEVMPLEDRLSDRLAENRLRTTLLTLFALTAIALVSIGLYGTISYLARIRQREVGLRLALGALPRQIVARFLLQGLRVTLAGALIGLLLGAAGSRLLSGMLYAVSALDPATYAGVLLLTLLLAAAGLIVPAFRASRVDPTQVLREE